MNLNKITFIFLALFSGSILCRAQEGLRPLNSNPNLIFSDLKVNLSSNPIKHQKKAVSISLPFKEDFSYAHLTNYPDQNLWSDSSVYVNTGRAIAPPSQGVATFEGLNKWGYPYQPNLINTNQSLPSDTLTSKDINLFTLGTKTLQPTDSVALSFYYQARGFGDTPEISDTFMVDLYKPKQGVWANRVWYVRGNTSPNTNDTIFKRGFVWISDTAYLHDGFKFRFRNKATNNGDFDNWHLDYVYLNQLRSMIADTTYDDLSFGYVPSPYLKRYSSIPWQQFQASETADKNTVFIRNNGDVSLNMTYENRMYKLPSNALTYTYTGGANPGLKVFRKYGWNDLAPHASPAFSHTFTAMTDSVDYMIKHYVYRSGPSNDFFPANDTIIQFQRFRNYYAYDDGSAEAAYYINGVGGKMAMKFKLNNVDTLRSVRIYFDPIGSLGLTETYTFRLHLWSELNGIPSTVILKDSLMNPKYLKSGHNVFKEYTLTSPLLLSPGEYFIGFQQNAAAGIAVAFDRNLNHMDNLYYDSGNGWTQSQIAGSLMMRPVFGKKILPPVGLSEQNREHDSFMIFPNPANDRLIIGPNDNSSYQYRILDLTGRILISGDSNGESSVDVSSLYNGVYFVTISSDKGTTQTHKIIVQH